MSDTAGVDRRAASGSIAETRAAMSVAVVGAGVAGAGVAYALRESDVAVSVFEREDRTGGRTATRDRAGCHYDIGANYVKPGDERVSRLLADFDDGDLVDVEAPVWTFDADGTIEAGDPDREDEHKWTFTEGIQTLPRRLLERSAASVHTNTPIDALVSPGHADDGKWWLETANGTRFGPVDAVVLTPPAPETAALLERSDGSNAGLESLGEAARAVEYRSTHSFALHYPFALERPYYALVNVDKRHDVSWLALEGAKRGHVPADETLLIVQMAADWSVANRDTPLAEVAESAATHAAMLLEDDRLAAPDWVDRRRWQYAQPEGDSSLSALESESDYHPDSSVSPATDVTEPRLAAERSGVYVAGDWVRGEGRIHAALASGLDVATRVQIR